MAVVVNNETDIEVDKAIFTAMDTISAAVLRKHALPLQTEISLTLCSNKDIHALNKKWRSVDAPTDVLSFPLHEKEEIADGIREPVLGDIVISLERAGEQAKDLGHSFEREILFLFTHGVLHLLGYDHITSDDQKEMRELEEELLQPVGAKRYEL